MPNSFLGNVWLTYGAYGVFRTWSCTKWLDPSPSGKQVQAFVAFLWSTPAPTKMIKTWVQSSIEDSEDSQGPIVFACQTLPPTKEGINSTRQHLTHPKAINFQESPIIPHMNPNTKSFHGGFWCCSMDSNLPTQHSQGSCTAAPPRNIDSGLVRPWVERPRFRPWDATGKTDVRWSQMGPMNEVTRETLWKLPWGHGFWWFLMIFDDFCCVWSVPELGWFPEIGNTRKSRKLIVFVNLYLFIDWSSLALSRYSSAFKGVQDTTWDIAGNSWA